MTEPPGFCGLGRDAKPGGELDDRDICSYTDQAGPLGLLPSGEN